MSNETRAPVEAPQKAGPKPAAEARTPASPQPLLRAAAGAGNPPLDPATVQRLQGAIGNRAVCGLLQRHPVDDTPDGMETSELEEEQRLEESAAEQQPAGTTRIQRTLAERRPGPTQPRILQRDVKKGEQLPQTGNMLEMRVENWLEQERARTRADSEARTLPDAKANLANEALWKKARKPLDGNGDEAVNAAKAALTPELDNAVELGEAVKAAMKSLGKNLHAKKALVEFQKLTMEFSEHAAAPEIAGVMNKKAELEGGGKKFSRGDAYLAVTGRKDAKLMAAYVPEEDKATFAAALMKLKSVTFFLGRREEKVKKADDKAETQWANGGVLNDDKTMVPDSWVPGRDKARFENATLVRRLDKVDWMLKGSVAPEVLKKIPRPKFNVHTKGAQTPTNWHGQRASCGSGIIDIGYDQSTAVIMHEVGHHLENVMPPAVWHDIHMLLDARHAEAGGGTADGGANPFTYWSEGGFKGKYVSGTYTARAYRSGGDEVFSMAMQYFSKPEDTKKLVEGDPLHAALILRALNPQDYAAVADLRAFDKYLPPPQAAPVAPQAAAPQPVGV